MLYPSRMFNADIVTCLLIDSASNAAGDWSLTLPDDVIADSARAQINVIGRWCLLIL